MESSRQTPPPAKFLQLSLALIFQAGSANTGPTETPNWKVIAKPGTEETQEGNTASPAEFPKGAGPRVLTWLPWFAAAGILRGWPKCSSVLAGWCLDQATGVPGILLLEDMAKESRAAQWETSFQGRSDWGCRLSRKTRAQPSRPSW